MQKNNRLFFLLALVLTAVLCTTTMTACGNNASAGGGKDQAATSQTAAKIKVTLEIKAAANAEVMSETLTVKKGTTALSILEKAGYKVSSHKVDGGTAVDAISQASNSEEKGAYWMWYHRGAKDKEPTMGETYADKYELKDGDIITWSYEVYQQ